jgi:hypothetical protein
MQLKSCLTIQDKQSLFQMQSLNAEETKDVLTKPKLTNNARVDILL